MCGEMLQQVKQIEKLYAAIVLSTEEEIDLQNPGEQAPTSD